MALLLAEREFLFLSEAPERGWTSVPLLAKSAEEKARLEKLSETEILAEAQKCISDKGTLQRTFHSYNDSPSNSQNNCGKS